MRFSVTRTETLKMEKMENRNIAVERKKKSILWFKTFSKATNKFKNTMRGEGGRKGGVGTREKGERAGLERCFYLLVSILPHNVLPKKKNGKTVSSLPPLLPLSLVECFDLLFISEVYL